ncbi:MAG TPA: SPOR domain-containing protein [Alphaproteobacteria bacterium]|nr:SPOR domain-containing protein [Alphaproteobacteria bacterium]
MTMNVGPVGTSRDPLRAIYEQKQKRPRRWRTLVGAASVFVLGVFALIVFYAYQEGKRAGTDISVPLIKGDQQPYKVKPDNPGGTDVPGQDKSIYSEVSPGVAGGNPPEQLLPPAESPLPKPASSSASTGNSTAPAPASGGTGAAAAPVAGSTASTASPPAAVHIPQITAPVASGQSGQAASEEPGATASTASRPAQLASRPQSGGWKIQLGSMRSSEEAEREWGHLQGKAPDVLGGLQLQVQRADLGPGKGVYFRIQAGPVGDQQAAAATCAKLKAAQIDCLAVKP